MFKIIIQVFGIHSVYNQLTRQILGPTWMAMESVKYYPYGHAFWNNSGMGFNAMIKWMSLGYK